MKWPLWELQFFRPYKCCLALINTGIEIKEYFILSLAPTQWNGDWSGFVSSISRFRLIQWSGTPKKQSLLPTLVTCFVDSTLASKSPGQPGFLGFSGFSLSEFGHVLKCNLSSPGSFQCLLHFICVYFTDSDRSFSVQNHWKLESEETMKSSLWGKKRSQQHTKQILEQSIRGNVLDCDIPSLPYQFLWSVILSSSQGDANLAIKRNINKARL